MERAPKIGFDRYIISATTPFTRGDLAGLRTNAPAIVKQHTPGFEPLYEKRGWKMFADIDRVYVNERARKKLGWQPKFDFAHILDRLSAGDPVASPLARAIGPKGYHEEEFTGGPYPLEPV